MVCLIFPSILSITTVFGFAVQRYRFRHGHLFRMDTLRPPPPSGAPPPYARPVFLTTSLIGFIWAMVVGVQGIEDLDDWHNGTLKTIELVLAILAFVIAAVELAAFIIGCSNKLSLAKFLVWLAPVGLLVACARELVVVAVHFAMKGKLINDCVIDETGESAYDSSGNIISMSAAQAQDVCRSAYNRRSWANIIWLIAVICFSILFLSIAMSYYRQLLDPSSVRQRVARYTEGAFQLQPQGPYAGPQTGYEQPYGQAPFRYSAPEGPPPPPGGYVPPYPGPPDANSPFAPRNDDATKASMGEFSHEAQERAWRDATENGPTVNAGHAPPAGPPPGHQRRADEGYDVGHNQEEEEAWARAREGGVTAHLTGHDGDMARQGGARV